MKNIHVIPTDKIFNENSIVLNTKSNLWILGKNIKNIVRNRENAHLLTQNIYITSDEEIKDCWVLNIYTNELYFVKGFYGIQPIIKKIILTIDQDLIKDGVQAIDDEFLEWFIKNPSCEFLEFQSFCKNGDNCPSQVDYDKQHLCDVGYKIIIPKEEPKQETLEEVAFRKRKELDLKGTIEGFMAGFKACEEQNKNLYSEEEVVNLLKKALTHKDDGKIGNLITAQNKIRQANFFIWFEQFKKKL